MRITRRRFGAGAVAAGALMAIGSRARAGGGSEPRARRLLVLHADGGMRSSAAFDASSRADLNPWGIASTTASGMRLGAIWTVAPGDVAATWTLPAWGDRVVPDLASIAPSLTLVAGTDHRPDGSHRAGDHGDDRPRMATGDVAGHPGLLTVVNRHLGDAATAPVMVTATDFAAAPGEWQSAQPTVFAGASMPSAPPPIGRADVGLRIEDAIDAAHASTRSGPARAGIERMLGDKRIMRRYGPVLAMPVLRPLDVPDAEIGGVTSAALMQALGATGHPDDVDVAIGLRCLQLGSPAAAIAIHGFDLHANEREQGPALYARFARYLCGIHFLLSEVDDPGGDGKMIDHTLVVTTSEFGRNAHPGGWNEGHGSDHAVDDAWRYQAHVLFGGGLRPQVAFPTDDSNAPIEGPCSTQALLYTLAAAVGVPETELERVWPSGTALHPETAPLWRLWE